jgi:hypothetical protein
MAIPKDYKLVKNANVQQKWTEEQIDNLLACQDKTNGPHYFLSNFFYIQHPVRGKLKYNAYPYQKRLVDSYHNHRFNINLLPRQTGKTTTAAGYLLWFAMFIPDSTILVAAHKYTGAQEIMQRIRYSYELCPDHIRCGVTSYNKQSIEFDNGSRIVAQTTTETTGRGMSISLLYADEFAFVEPSIAAEFWTSIRPTLATGGKAILTSTPNSDEDQFALIWKDASYRFDEHGNSTKLGRNGFFPFRAHWSEHPERDEKWAAIERASIGEERFKREHECITGESKLKIKFPNGDIKLLTVFDLELIMLGKDLFVEEYLKNNLNLQVMTDSGWNNFDGLIRKGQRPTIKVQTETQEIETTHDHEFFIEGMGRVSAKDLTLNHKIITSSGTEMVISIKDTNRIAIVYDLYNVGKNHRFFANGLLVSNCEFLVFDETLINSLKLANLEGKEPYMKMGQCRWYKKIKPTATYIVALDPSLGTGGDPAAIQILEIPSFEQTGEWQHNLTTIQGQARILRDICNYINDECAKQGSQANLYFSIENNAVGEAALVAITEIGEETIPGLFLSEPIKKGHIRRFRKGFNTTHSAKISICAKLKYLIESDKLKIYSKPLISELKTYVAKGISFSGKTGSTDDLVSSMLLALRMIMMLQEWDPSIYDKMREEREDEWIMPMPIYITH